MTWSSSRRSATRSRQSAESPARSRRSRSATRSSIDSARRRTSSRSEPGEIHDLPADQTRSHSRTRRTQRSRRIRRPVHQGQQHDTRLRRVPIGSPRPPALQALQRLRWARHAASIRHGETGNDDPPSRRAKVPESTSYAQPWARGRGRIQDQKLAPAPRVTCVAGYDWDHVPETLAHAESWTFLLVRSPHHSVSVMCPRSTAARQSAR